MQEDRSQIPVGRLCAHCVVLLSRDDPFQKCRDVRPDSGNHTPKRTSASCLDSWLNASDEVLIQRRQTQPSRVCLRPSRTRKRGASRSSRTLEAGCDERTGCARRAKGVRTAESCGPGAPTLASSLAKTFCKATVAKKPGTPAVHRGEHEDKPLKPIAQGMPDRFGEPVD
jgi:hypothetical protein